MLRQFIEDKELDLTKQNDLLGTKCYAEELVSTIENVPQGHSYSIGVYGGWGTGKSTILRTAKTKLETNPDKKVKVVVYDAWKYVNDSFRRMFLLNLQRELGLEQTELMSRFYSSANKEDEGKTILSAHGVSTLIIWIILLFILVISSIYVEKISPTVATWMTPSASGLAILALLYKLWKGSFKDLKMTIVKPVVFAPEQFETCFKQMLSEVLRETTWFEKLKKWTEKYVLRKDKVSVSDLDKLVIVIDNIDRCSNDVAYTLLTDIKTFLSNENYDVVFVVPVDDVALRKHLFTQANDEVQRDTEEFLRKFFNVIIRIRTHQPEDMLHYVHELNKAHKLNLNANTLALIAKEFAKNPRRIVQLINNLTVEQALYKDDFATDKETLIAAILVLREEYSDMVNKIKDDISLAQKYYELSNEELEKTIGSKLSKNAEFASYMRMAKQTFLKADASDLMRILTNTTHVLDKLTAEIKEAISSYDYKFVLLAIRADDSIRQDVFLYLKKELENARSYNAVDQIQNAIDFVALINFQMPLRWDELHPFNEIVMESYKDTLKKSTNCQEIVSLAKQMSNCGLYELKTNLFDFVKDPINNSFVTYQEYVSNVIKHFDTIEDCEFLHDWAEEYFFNNVHITDFDFSETQKQYLLTDSYVIKWVENVSSLDDITTRDNIVWCCENVKGIKTNTFDKFFIKIKELYGNQSSVNVKKSMGAIEYIAPIMSLLPSGQYKSFEDLYGEIMKQYVVTDVYGRPTSTKESLVSKVDESNAEKIAEFCFEAYRLILKKSVVASHLAKLCLKCETYIKARLLYMLHDGEDLSDFVETIQEFTAGHEDIFELMPILFEKNKVGESLVADEVKKDKLTLALGNLQFASAVDFIVKVTKDEEVKKFFLSLLPLSDYDYLNKLPSALLSIIVTIYSEDNKDEFKNNNGFLKVVLQSGNSSQKKLVKQTLLSRIIDNNDVEGVKDLLPLCKLTEKENRKFEELLTPDDSEEDERNSEQ